MPGRGRHRLATNLFRLGGLQWAASFLAQIDGHEYVCRMHTFCGNTTHKISCYSSLVLAFFYYFSGFTAWAVRVVVFAVRCVGERWNRENIRLFGASSEYSSDEAFQVLKGPV